LKEKITSQLVFTLSRRKWKIQSEDRHIRTYYWRCSISETRREMETNHVFIKDMQAAEINYKIYDKELLAIVEALTK